jgi:hypothetical protein
MDFEYIRKICRETLGEKGNDYPFKAADFLAKDIYEVYTKWLAGEATRDELTVAIERLESLSWLMKESIGFWDEQ